MRTKKSTINMITAVVSQVIVIALGFISRKVMIDSVGVEYLGINGLMGNILIILSLAESGIGAAIVYALYKPLAENDVVKIKGLMNFYKKTYRSLAIFTAIVGISVIPFLGRLMKNNTVENYIIIYLLFLFSSVCSYLFSYKVSINNADQNKYLYTFSNTVTQIFVLILKVIILKVTKNYILFLSVDIFATLTKNIIFSKIVDKKYPYLKEMNNTKLDKETRNTLLKNVKGLFIGKIGYIISTSSDNLVISSKISIKTVGLYSNYTTLTSAVYGFVSIFISSISASVGNLVAEESDKKIYEIFKVTTFINYWIYMFSYVSLYCLSEHFITLWLGKKYIMGKSVLLVILVNFLIDGMLEPIGTVKNAAGIYYVDRYVPIIAAVFNLTLSLILVKPLGIVGVFLATILSKVFFTFWINPLLVFKMVFKKSPVKYFIKVLFRIGMIMMIAFAMNLILSSWLVEYSLMNFIIKMIICLILPNIVFITFYYKNDEFKYLFNILNSIKDSINNKIRSRIVEIGGNKCD